MRSLLEDKRLERINEVFKRIGTLEDKIKVGLLHLEPKLQVWWKRFVEFEESINWKRPPQSRSTNDEERALGIWIIGMKGAIKGQYYRKDTDKLKELVLSYKGYNKDIELWFGITTKNYIKDSFQNLILWLELNNDKKPNIRSKNKEEALLARYIYTMKTQLKILPIEEDYLWLKNQLLYCCNRDILIWFGVVENTKKMEDWNSCKQWVITHGLTRPNMKSNDPIERRWANYISAMRKARIYKGVKKTWELPLWLEKEINEFSMNSDNIKEWFGISVNLKISKVEDIIKQNEVTPSNLRENYSLFIRYGINIRNLRKRGYEDKEFDDYIRTFNDNRLLEIFGLSVRKTIIEIFIENANTIISDKGKGCTITSTQNKLEHTVYFQLRNFRKKGIPNEISNFLKENLVTHWLITEKEKRIILAKTLVSYIKIHNKIPSSKDTDKSIARLGSYRIGICSGDARGNASRFGLTNEVKKIFIDNNLFKVILKREPSQEEIDDRLNKCREE